MSILQQFASNNYIVVNKTFIKLFGLEEAIILGELCSEYDFWEKNEKLVDGMFFCSVNKLEENTGLNDYQQRKAIKHLEKEGVIKTALKGVPATRYFYIDETQLLNFLKPSSENFKELDVKNLKPSNYITNNNKNKTISLSNDKDIVAKNSLPSKNISSQFLGSAKTKQHKETLYSKCISLINEFTDDDSLKNLLIKFLKVRLANSQESGIPFYQNNFKGLLNTLKKLAENTSEQKQIVKQTLDNGWNSFYELKNNTTNNSKKHELNYLEGERKNTDYEKLDEDIERWKENGVEYVF